MNILIVDDQRSARRILADFVARVQGTVLFEASSLEEARKVLQQHVIDVALVDVHLGPDMSNADGLVLLRELRSSPQTVAIVVTVSGGMADVREAMRSGAYSYILKDELCEELVLPVLEDIRNRQHLVREVTELRARLQHEDPLRHLVGTSPAMETLRKQIVRVASSFRPVLVMGSTGTGKELVAQGIHSLGPNPSAPLLDLNCGAIPENLMEAMLFGHARGAFTGADRKSDGYLLSVRKGTLFLDEVAELPLMLQSKLLRVLETGKFRPVGSMTEEKFEGRIVAATHADLDQRVREGRFRQDLLFRLNVLILRTPDLADRREDIPMLVAHFVRSQPRPLQFTTEAMDTLGQLEWEGNIRQLRNLIDRISVFAEGDVVTAETLSAVGVQAAEVPDKVQDIVSSLLRMPLAGNRVRAVTDALVSEALRLSNGNKSAAARLLGMHRKAVERRLSRRDDDDDELEPED